MGMPWLSSPGGDDHDAHGDPSRWSAGSQPGENSPHVRKNPVSDPHLLIGIALTALVLALNTIAGWLRKPRKQEAPRFQRQPGALVPKAVPLGLFSR